MAMVAALRGDLEAARFVSSRMDPRGTARGDNRHDEYNPRALVVSRRFSAH